MQFLSNHQTFRVSKVNRNHEKDNQSLNSTNMSTVDRSTKVAKEMLTLSMIRSEIEIYCKLVAFI